MPTTEGRTRKTKALRRQQKIEATLDRSWMKHARCKICRRKFVANNYADHKVRLNHLKIGGKLLCPWCKHRDGKFVVQLYLIVEKVAAKPCPNMKVPYSDRLREPYLVMLEDTCKCEAHVAKRVLKAHDEAPTIQ